MSSQEQGQERDKIRFAFSKAPDYKVVPANEAWGGITPRGDFLINFAVVSTPVPALLIQELKEGGALGEEIERVFAGEARPDVHRELQTGILMSMEEAESVAKWILTKIGQHREAEQEE